MPHKDNETKRLILKKALELIKQNGYDNVTLNDICQAAGISRHTFYYYFSSKDDILRDFYQIPRDISQERLSSILSAENNVEQLWQLFEPMIDFVADTGAEIMTRILIANIKRDIGTFELKKEKVEEAKAHAAIIKRAQENGEIRNCSHPVALLHTHVLQLFGVFTSWCMAKGCFDLKQFARSAFEVFFDVKQELRKAKEKPFEDRH